MALLDDARPPRHGAPRAPRAPPGAGLLAFVEYNLADSEVVLLYALAMGLTGPSLLRAAPDPAAAAEGPASLLPGRRRTWAWLLAFVLVGAALGGAYALLCRSYLRILALG